MSDKEWLEQEAARWSQTRQRPMFEFRLEDIEEYPGVLKTDIVSFARVFYRAIEGVPCVEWADNVTPMNVLDFAEVDQVFFFMAGRLTRWQVRDKLRWIDEAPKGTP